MPVSKGGVLLDIQVTGARDIQGRFAVATAAITAAQRAEMRELGRRVVRILQVDAPVRTGRLRRGIGFDTYGSGSDVTLKVTSEAPYTKYVIRGRGPVVPIKAKALRFEPGPPGSGFIFRKRVGPARANPFQRKALSSVGDEGLQMVRRMGARVKRAYYGR